MTRAVVIRPLSSVPAALKALDRLEVEIRRAPTYKALDDMARTAAAIQQKFRPVKQVSDRAGKVWVIAEEKLDEELAAIPKSTGGDRAGRRQKIAGTRRVRANAPPTLAELGVDRKRAARAKRLRAIPAAEKNAYVKELESEGAGISPSAVLKKHKEATRETKRAEYAARVSAGGSASSLEKLIADGHRFSVIYADPPWTFEVYSGKGKERSAERHYDTMTLDAIKSLPIGKLAAPDCALLLWGVWPELPGALDVIKTWGFAYKTAGFVWVKQNRGGAGIFTGMGYWSRANTEPCFLATRGSPTRLNADVHQVIMAPVGQHSAKPEEARSRIERLLPGPYLELFAREPRKGWVTWGNEIAT